MIHANFHCKVCDDFLSCLEVINGVNRIAYQIDREDPDHLTYFCPACAHTREGTLLPFYNCLTCRNCLDGQLPRGASIDECWGVLSRNWPRIYGLYHPFPPVPRDFDLQDATGQYIPCRREDNGLVLQTGEVIPPLNPVTGVGGPPKRCRCNRCGG